MSGYGVIQQLYQIGDVHILNTQNVVQFGNVNVTNTTGQVTPEDIASGLELYTEQNPPQRTTRNFV